MPVKERKTWIIYPEYFDARLSRSDCRRVPKNIAVNSPKAEEISKILNKRDIPNRVEQHKHHPSTWFKKRGRVMINKRKKPKQQFLKGLGKELKKLRK